MGCMREMAMGWVFSSTCTKEGKGGGWEFKSTEMRGEDGGQGQ